ncbi:hypothetical protein [Comamonas thiooxydans]|uniref:hypothetical protein n=1 Tax=Comamonas thiooxydans TaxID=363952 RepID=UPI002114CEF8|nr:hypothetical protein [Comamonas thiooxydans]UUE94485.1 hypothetical protein MJ608_02045 [Comamonas thiooxydans]
MSDLLEIPQEQLLQEQVQTVVLLEPQGSDDIVEVPTEQLLLQAGQDNTLLEPVHELVLLTDSQQGPPGPPGIPGPAGGQVLQRKAGMDTSALLVVYEDLFGSVWPADPDAESDVLALLGVTVSAAVAGQPINVQRLGHIDDEAWQLQPGKRVFLGGQGRLTQEPPQAGYDVLIGMAITSTRLLLNIQDPIELE